MLIMFIFNNNYFIVLFCFRAFQAARKSVDSCRNEQDRLRKRKDVSHYRLKGNFFNELNAHVLTI